MSIFATEIIAAFALRTEQVSMLLNLWNYCDLKTIANPEDFDGRMAFVHLVEGGWLDVATVTTSGIWASARLSRMAQTRLYFLRLFIGE